MDPLLAVVLVYSAQILLVVAAATMADALGRIANPAVRLLFWRGVAAACLALPLFASFMPATAAVTNVTFTTSPVAAAAVAPVAAATATRSTGSILLWILLAGMLVRLGWLASGMLRLRYLRRHSTLIEPGDHLDDLRFAIAPHAELRISPHVAQPATFGHSDPVILLPPSFESMDVDSQRAVVCHELLHISRRDWIWIVGEELARAVFWFHPAVWWLLERTELSREQLIDRLVTTRTASKRAYMSALLSFAGSARAATVATAFLRPRHLRSRLRQLGKEPTMTGRRLIFTGIFLAFVTGGTVTAVVRALPLEIPALAQSATGSLEVRLAEREPGPGLTEVAGPGQGERLYVHPPVVTGADVASARVATVLTDNGQRLNVDAVGVAVTFTAPAASRLRAATQSHVGKPLAIVVDGRVISAPVVRDPIEGAAVISGLTPEQAKRLTDFLSPAGRPQAAVQAIEPGVAPPVPVTQPKPSYTREAMLRRIQGTVTMRVVVLADGTVGDVEVIKPLGFGLDEEAIATMKQWRFRPGTRNGQPVAVRVVVEMTFQMRDAPQTK